MSATACQPIADLDERLARIRRFRAVQDARRRRRLLRYLDDHRGCTVERVAAHLQVRTNTIAHDIADLDGRVLVDGDDGVPFRLRRLRVVSPRRRERRA